MLVATAASRGFQIGNRSVACIKHRYHYHTTTADLFHPAYLLYRLISVMKLFVARFARCKLKVKVKASHTRHRALGPELIPVYRQSACR